MAIMDEIKEAEAQALKIKEDAKAAARSDAEIIESEAKKKAEEMKEVARKNAEAILAKAEKRASEITRAAKAESDETCHALATSAKPNFEAAVAAIYKGALEV